MKGFLCTENSEIGVLTSREANAARKAHRVMNKLSLQEPRMRLRRGPTYLATAGSPYTQHLGAVKPQTSPPSCHPVLLVLASHRLELLDQMLPSCSKPHSMPAQPGCILKSVCAGWPQHRHNQGPSFVCQSVCNMAVTIQVENIST